MARILVVDDSPTETRGFVTILTRQGHEVLTAATGTDGVEMAKSEAPDLILMDVVMPGVNGFQATRQLSRDAGTAHIPVVVVSTKDQQADRVWAERQGARAYLTKPVDEGDLLDVLDRLLG